MPFREGRAIDNSVQKGTTAPAKQHKHWNDVYVVMFVVMPLLSMLFLFLEHVTHVEFLLHLAAIPLEILLGAFLVERFLAKKEKQAKLQQLMYIKSYLFRSELRNVYLSNFRALQCPDIDMEEIAGASLAELKAMRDAAESITYEQAEDLEPVILAYVHSHKIFQMFMEWAIANDIENIFHDMLYILHFIQDVKLFKSHHPDKLFMHEAARHPELLEKVHRILLQGVHKFFDYIIELKDKQPFVFDELITDYLLSSKIKPVPEGGYVRKRKTDFTCDADLDLRGSSKPGMRMMNISP